jgi:DNA modification methylase
MAKRKPEEPLRGRRLGSSSRRPEISLIDTPSSPEAARLNDTVGQEIPRQTEFYKLPTRFGAVPVDEAPLGWEVETRRRETKVTKFEHAYPRIYLPFQEVQRVEFGHSDTPLNPLQRRGGDEVAGVGDGVRSELFPKGANRLFFGDCLHVMRQLPNKCIDTIYADPPFFSGRNYNVIFGDKNEVRSFTDIWEGGMPGYLVWLNARLYEMKRLLKDTGSIYVHLDWHASHYVKVEMDKMYGADRFRTEIVWEKIRVKKAQSKDYPKVHDSILCYSKSESYFYYPQSAPISEKYKESHFTQIEEDTGKRYQLVSLLQGGQGPPRRFGDRVIEPPPGRHWIWGQDRIDEALVNGRIVFPTPNRPRHKRYLEQSEETGVPVGDLWYDIPPANSQAKERIGYPTQKPEGLLDRIIKASTEEGDVVADFFCGGGTTPAVAQRLNRRWIACDQSRIAVAVTADRIARVVEDKIGKLFPVPDFTVEHWGIYESPKLEKLSQKEFKEFVVKAFGGKPESVSPSIHGARHGVPLYVGDSSRRSRITKEDVAKFAQAIFKERHTNFGAMLAWNFGPDARKAAEILAARENKRIDFVRLNLVRLEDDAYREHIVTKHKDYRELLSFIQPPEVRIAHERIGKCKYRFDVSESVSLNKDGVIANVQWDFDYRNRFSSTEGFAFLRDKKTGKPVLVVEYEFPSPGKPAQDRVELTGKESLAGKKKIACSVQDDQGGERTEIVEMEVK